MNDNIGLMVRRSVRHEISLPGEYAIDGVHAELIQFGSGAGHRDGWVECTIADIGTGGVGFMSSVFVPRGAHLKVRMYRLGGGREDVLAEVRVVVRRIVMTDSRPGYLVGTAFVSDADDDRGVVDELIEMLDVEGGAVSGGVMSFDDDDDASTEGASDA